MHKPSCTSIFPSVFNNRNQSTSGLPKGSFGKDNIEKQDKIESLVLPPYYGLE
jgi:hypothetical protein